MEYPVLASSSRMDIDPAVDLLAGSSPWSTDRGVTAATGPGPILQYQIVCRAADGTIVALDPGTNDADVVGFAAYDCELGDNLAFYNKGDFNYAKLSPANPGLTLAAMQALFVGSPIAVMTVL